MGRLHSVKQQKETIHWAINYKPVKKRLIGSFSFEQLKAIHKVDLDYYFALSCLSRSKTAPRELVTKAHKLVFWVRTKLEKNITKTLENYFEDNKNSIDDFFKGSFFGASKKQGTSIRFPLTTCSPTKICRSECYAHDVLDAAPNAVIRGTINGLIANTYESSNYSLKTKIKKNLTPHCIRAIRMAKRELESLPEGWTRRARIRFSHVGEIVEYPNFANYLARTIIELSKGSVDCIVYSRRKEIACLDKDLWVINFTIDKKSFNRVKWIVPHARTVYSAFDGELSPSVATNFLGHHRWAHSYPKGIGQVCPATHPDTKVRTCDACRCCLCFESVT